MRSVAAFVLFLFLASSALAQSRHYDRRRHLSFPVPAGWTQVSEEELKDTYELHDDGVDDIPRTLAAWEKNPAKPTSEPTLVLRYRRLRHTDATAAWERLKTDAGAVFDEILAEREITKAYKIGKLTFDEEAASVRIPFGYESLHTEDVKMLTVRFLGQYGIAWLEFRGAKGPFGRSSKEIEATVAGFEWDRTFQVNYVPEPAAPAPAPAPVPTTDPNEQSSGSSPFDEPARDSDLPISPGVIAAIVAVLVGIGVLALVVVKLGEGNRPPPRRRGGGYRRR
ncbi:MAG: hypothetical protein ABFS86_01040 [Planctomycetota bacterium]